MRFSAKINENAFTLPEVIIVVVMIGILASIGMPIFLKTIEKSRGAEAREILYKSYAGYQRLAMEGENLSGPPWDTDENWMKLGMEDPSNLPSPPRHFQYQIRRVGGASGVLTVRALSLDSGADRLWIYLHNGTLDSTALYK